MALNDARLFPFYAIAEELGVPCLVHTGFTRLPECRLDWQDPELLDEVGAAFPDLQLWMAHGGGPKWESAFLILNKYPNMAADLSFSAKYPIRMRAESLAFAKHLGLLPRLMWGTDYPFWGHADDLEWWRSLPKVQRDLGLEPALTEEDLEGLLGGNAARLLEL
jgi:predicted TIM-barrel fold metal-dependent hydrolase